MLVASKRGDSNVAGADHVADDSIPIRLDEDSDSGGAHVGDDVVRDQVVRDVDNDPDVIVAPADDIAFHNVPTSAAEPGAEDEPEAARRRRPEARDDI